MDKLPKMQIAVIATDGVEESELTEPVAALKEAGARVSILSVNNRSIQSFRHHDKSNVIHADQILSEVGPGRFDAVMLPGGALNADALRAEPKVLEFLSVMQEEGKPIAAICHAPWELISAGVVKSRRLTSYHTIKDDVRNAGGEWVDREVVVDHNWVTSRQPGDIPAFNQAMIQIFAESTAQKPGRQSAA